MPLVGRIVGGREVKPHSIPWQVSLVARKGAKSQCGGMIINERVILTAAHCVDIRFINRMNHPPPLPWYVVAKKHNFADKKEGEYHGICKVLINRGWKAKTKKFDYDFALLFLKSPIYFDEKAAPVCLASRRWPKRFLVGKPLRVSGWGRKNEGGKVATGLRAVKVRGMSNRNCQKKYYDPITRQKRVKITKTMLCAGTKRGKKDSCQGDSGGKKAKC